MKEEIKSALKEKLAKLGLPAPDQLLPEIKRLNDNLEEVAPSLKKLDKFLDGMSAQELVQTIKSFLK